MTSVYVYKPLCVYGVYKCMCVSVSVSVLVPACVHVCLDASV